MRGWLWAAMLGLASGQAEVGKTYTVEPEASQIFVDVGTAGFLQIFGHEHRIVTERFTGEVEWFPEAPERSRFSLQIDAGTLKVADEDVSEEDRAAIQSDMETKALALSEHPSIRFTSSSVEVRSTEGEEYQLNVAGLLELRGVEKRLEVPLRVDVSEDRFVATGDFELESDTWGVPQISAVGGTVKTSEELEISFEIAATP